MFLSSSAELCSRFISWGGDEGDDDKFVSMLEFLKVVLGNLGYGREGLSGEIGV